MKILLLGSQHGNEPLGELLSAHIAMRRPELAPYINYRVGNPRAQRLNVRYTESDMNRSYGVRPHTYESRRASIIERHINNSAYDIVLDLHTTNCVQPACFIAGTLSPTVRRLIRASPIEHIVLMQHPMVRQSLIGRVPHAVSIEIAHPDLSQTTLDQLCDTIMRYIHDQVLTARKNIYEARNLIEKATVTDTQAATFVNFQPSAAGFIPILTGENSYKKNTAYLGFKASTVTKITV